MRELSLNILDIAENSVKANAKEIRITIRGEGNLLTISIADNGCGMSEEFLKRVTDPYTTTRTTRKVGMGIPLIKMEAEMSGGSFDIKSKLGVGTTVTVSFEIDHIDRPPLGNIADSLVTLICSKGESRIIFDYEVFDCKFVLDTQELERELDGITLDEPEIMVFLREMIKENTITNFGGVLI